MEKERPLSAGKIDRLTRKFEDVVDELYLSGLSEDDVAEAVRDRYDELGRGNWRSMPGPARISLVFSERRPDDEPVLSI
jgi:hypothetical protein